jgi:hypothetical protein
MAGARPVDRYARRTVGETGRDMEELLAQLRATVAERRASGQYPEGLEAGLDAHFQRIVARRPGLPRLAVLRRRVDAARRSARFTPARIPASSRLPGGEAVHRGLAKLFFRQAQGILLQVQEFADRTLEALEAVVAVLEAPDNHRHNDLVELLDTHTEILSRRERAPELPVERLDDLLGRVEALEAAGAARRWHPPFTRDRFDAAFGDQGRHRAQELVAPRLGGLAPVVDLTAADDPVSALAGRPPAAAAGIVLIGADDRLPAAGLVDLIVLAADRLQVGGRLVITCGEPPPVEAPVAGAPARFDPSLGPPLAPGYAAFACCEAGYASVDLESWPEPGWLLVATR